MISATRREALRAALAAPAVVSLPSVAIARGSSTLLVHDPELAVGRRLSDAHDGETLAIQGDRIRFARALFERQPSFVVGVSRPVDALLIEDVGREAGYVPVDEGTDVLRAMIGSDKSLDRGFVLGWALAKR